MLLSLEAAAAAGWRCYSQPGHGRAAQQPDFPEQETEFFLRFLADRKFRQLGPLEPDLSRGTISFAPAMQLPLRPGRLKVLVVSPFLPYPLAHGGAVRIFNLCRELSGCVDFILIGVAAKRMRKCITKSCTRQSSATSTPWISTSANPNNASLPRQVRAAQSASLRALIKDVCERLRPHLTPD